MTLWPHKSSFPLEVETKSNNWPKFSVLLCNLLQLFGSQDLFINDKRDIQTCLVIRDKPNTRSLFVLLRCKLVLYTVVIDYVIKPHSIEYCRSGLKVFTIWWRKAACEIYFIVSSFTPVEKSPLCKESWEDSTVGMDVLAEKGIPLLLGIEIYPTSR